MTTSPSDRCWELVDTLHAARQTGYGDTLGGPLDAQFSELAKIYAAADEPSREAVREIIPDDMRLLLLGFSNRLATIAARQSEPNTLFEALLSHAIEDFRHDPRENIPRLALVHHVAQLLQLDSEELFSRVAALASTSAAGQLVSFAARSEEMKCLKVMRYERVETPEGLVFRRHR